MLFGIDKGITSSGFANGFDSLLPNIGYLGAAIAAALALTVAPNSKKAIKTAIACVLIAALILSPSVFSNIAADNTISGAPQINLKSDNLMEGAKIVYESLKRGEKADAVNLLSESGNCWTAQDPDRTPEEGYPDINNCYTEIELDGEKTFNTAIIEESGNEVQYFRLQALINDEWVTVYQSEKYNPSVFAVLMLLLQIISDFQLISSEALIPPQK